jgi:hypothetical protein
MRDPPVLVELQGETADWGVRKLAVAVANLARSPPTW